MRAVIVESPANQAGNTRRNAPVTALTGAGEVFVSSTVKDLVAGFGLRFGDRGSHSLKGVPGKWRTFAVQPWDERRDGRRSVCYQRSASVLVGWATFADKKAPRPRARVSSAKLSMNPRNSSSSRARWGGRGRHLLPALFLCLAEGTEGPLNSLEHRRRYMLARTR
jgi:hypothetical protein